MIDRDAVESLYATFAWALDTHDDALLAGVFAENATLSWETDGGDAGGPVEGRDAIVVLFHGVHEELTDKRRHVVSNVRVNGSESTAYVVILGSADGEIGIRTAGFYRAVLTTEDGLPCFASLHAAFDVPGR